MRRYRKCIDKKSGVRTDMAPCLRRGTGTQKTIYSFLKKASVFSSHEHIGSLTPFGKAMGPWFPTDLVPALPPGRTTLLDLLFSPYLAMPLMAAGASYPSEKAFENDSDFLEAIDSIRDSLSAIAGVGTLVALDKGLSMLHGVGLYEALSDSSGEMLCKLNRNISSRYAGYFDWYAEVMRKTGTKALLKPVHPAYVTAMEKGTGGEELRFVIPILRVDSLIGFPDDTLGLDFSGVETPAGFSIKNADDLDEMIRWFFDLVDRFRIPSIKQLQAYYRTISVSDVARTDMADALKEILSSRTRMSCDTSGKAAGQVRVNSKAVVAVQDYIMRQILEEADHRALPYQIHTGMTTLADSNPGLLEPLIRQYRNVQFVLLHAYPFVSHAAYLARTHPNVWVDTSWLALQSPHVLRSAMMEYVGMVPASRITASMDATSLEEYAGALAMTREALSDVLAVKVEMGDLSLSEALQMGERVHTVCLKYI